MKILKYIRKSHIAKSEGFFPKIEKNLEIRTSNNEIYKEAFTHSSVNLKDADGKSINFERLEFLGDALLNTIIAEYLFEYYPIAKEGALTKMRAKIVSRSKLNQIGKEMGLFELARISNSNNFGEDIHGNLLESFIGAIFVDQGYNKTKNYVVKKIIPLYVDIENIDNVVLSHKAYLIEWGQKEKEDIQFITKEDGGVSSQVNYCAKVLVNKKLLTKSKALSKKKAEEKAAKIAIRILKLKDKPINS